MRRQNALRAPGDAIFRSEIGEGLRDVVQRRPRPLRSRREFILGTDPSRIPAEARHFASLLLLDTLGVAAAAHTMEPARIARDAALRLYGAGPQGPAAKMLFDARSASVPGALFAAAAQIDNLDAHDGYNPSKGHTGVVAVPALLAFAQTVAPLRPEEALAALVIGYEVGARAAIALHMTVSDYHSSGAWNALAVAALGGRLRRLGADRMREALGIAEYYGPRSQMMRVIDHPTMLHDGSAFGALAGASAVFLAEAGYTGAPAITVEGERPQNSGSISARISGSCNTTSSLFRSAAGRMR